MKALVIGSGGREHALAWKLKESPKITDLYIAPGNAGTASVGENIPASTSQGILIWLAEHPVDLVIIGPDNYLAEGLTNSIQTLGIPVFGPTKAAAEIEWSKSYAKQFMHEEGIPTAEYQIFETADKARGYVRHSSFPIVLKADGLAAGKGVIIAKSLIEAENAIVDIMEKKAHGEAGARIVIEDYLEGFEISVHAFCDGENAVLFPASKDHKRIFDGDEGPNTGGMGTVAPVPYVTEQQMDLVREQIILPTLRGLKKRGRPFRGALFPGIMLTKDGPHVIEFNARFGDPETQSYMRILESDLFDILYACASGSLSNVEVKWSGNFVCCVVLASRGYPSSSKNGVPVTLPADSENVVVFHSATTNRAGQLMTAGGRVLGITATGETLKQAIEDSYQVISPNIFEGCQYRKDIGATSL